MVLVLYIGQGHYGLSPYVRGTMVLVHRSGALWSQPIGQGHYCLNTVHRSGTLWS